MRPSAQTCRCPDPGQCECGTFGEDRPGFLLVWVVGAFMVGVSLLVLTLLLV